MVSLNATPEGGSESLSLAQGTDVRVFQPSKLTEFVEMIDLMGRVSQRIREDHSQDLGGGAMTTQQAEGTGTSARDLAIANLPAARVMREKLVSHIRSEIKHLKRQAQGLSRRSQKGSAYLLNEVYKKIRRLSALIDELLAATAEVIQRFYIAVFIDRRPILVGVDSPGRSG